MIRRKWGRVEILYGVQWHSVRTIAEDQEMPEGELRYRLKRMPMKEALPRPPSAPYLEGHTWCGHTWMLKKQRRGKLWSYRIWNGACWAWTPELCESLDLDSRALRLRCVKAEKRPDYTWEEMVAQRQTPRTLRSPDAWVDRFPLMPPRILRRQ